MVPGLAQLVEGNILQGWKEPCHNSLEVAAAAHIAAAEHTAEGDIVDIATEVAAVEAGEHGNLDTVEEVADNCMSGHEHAVGALIDEAFEVDAANWNAPRWVLNL